MNEKTDTCPDCSNQPCDCGIPAGYQSDIRFAANFAPHIKVVEVSKLIEVMQQRDELLRYNEAYRQDALICADCDAISKEEYDRAIEQIERFKLLAFRATTLEENYREQRDRLAEALNKYRGQVDNEGNHSAPEAIQSLNQNVKVHTPLPATASDETGVKP